MGAKDKAKQFFSDLNDKIRRSKFGGRIVSLYEGFGQEGMRGPSPVAHPIEFYRAIRWGQKKTNDGAGKAYAVGTAVRTRLLNGPELNIILLGVPFLIDFGISSAVLAAKKAKKKKADKKAKKQPIVVTPKPLVSKFKKAAQAPPLPLAPFSDEAHKKVYLALVELGMSIEGATKVASGEFEGQEVADHLNIHDIDVLCEFLTSDEFVNYDLEIV